TGEKYLVIVGAAHMVGEKGLIQLLKNKGYSLKQL
ncbi:MAG: TraB/GumN family protein, partial [bacterium]|nr:TraB/GumN family protein [bacterium]